MRSLVRSLGLPAALIFTALGDSHPGVIRAQSAPSSDHVRANEPLLEEAHAHLRRRELRSAEAKLRQFLAHRPNHVSGMLYLAITLYHLKKFPESHRVFSELSDKKQLPKFYRFYAGYAAYKDGDYRRAFNLLREVERSHDSYDIAMYYAGASLHELSQYETALSYLRRAVVVPVAMADSKKLLTEDIEKRLGQGLAASSSSSVKKKAVAKTTTPDPASTTEVTSPTDLKAVKSLAGVHVGYWSLDPTFDPPRKINPYGYGLAGVSYRGGWNLARDTEASLPYSLGIDIQSGLEYAVEYLREVVVPHGTDLQGPYQRIPVAVEGARHDNISVFLGLAPWLEWQIFSGGKVGIEVSALGYYGEYQEQSLLAHGFGALYVLLPLSRKVLASLRVQGDFWPNLWAGRSQKYGASLELSSQIHPFFEVDVSGASALHELSKKSYAADQTHSGAVILRYLSPAKVSFELGGEMEFWVDYRIHRRSEGKNKMLKAQGRRLALLGGVVAQPFRGLKVRVQYSTSALSWVPHYIGAEAEKEWLSVAPISQDILMTHLVWDVDLDRTHISWKEI